MPATSVTPSLGTVATPPADDRAGRAVASQQREAAVGQLLALARELAGRPRPVGVSLHDLAERRVLRGAHRAEVLVGGRLRR